MTSSSTARTGTYTATGDRVDIVGERNGFLYVTFTTGRNRGTSVKVPPAWVELVADGAELVADGAELVSDETLSRTPGTVYGPPAAEPRHVIRSVNYVGGVNVRRADDGTTWSVRIGRTVTDGLTSRAAAELVAPAVTFPGAGIVGDVDAIASQLDDRAKAISREMGN